MPTSNINLLPPAYLMRKTVRITAACAVAGVIAVAGGLVAYAMQQSARNADLKQQQTEWQTRAQNVADTKSRAEGILGGAAEYTQKTDFVKKVFAANAKWATIFENIRDYTYPRVTYTTIKPTAGSTTVTMHVKIPGTPKIPPQEALNLYWANLLRSPMIEAAIPSGNLGYPQQSQNTQISGTIPMGPGGPSGAPGPMPGGPPMPGGRYIGSPGQIAGPAVEGSNSMNLLQGREGGWTDLGAGGQAVTAATNPMYDFDITAQMTDSVTVPTFGTAAQQTQQGGLV